MSVLKRLNKSIFGIAVFLSAIALVLVIGSCGTFNKSNNAAEPKAIVIPINLKSSLIKIGLNLTGSNPGVPVSSFVVTLDGCASGLTGNNTIADITVYLGDSGCLIKLVSFVSEGKTYSATAAGATNFKSWGPNEIATFANPDNANELASVQIASQLSDPIVESDFVSFNVYFKTGGDNANVVIINNPVSIFVAGQTPPNFKIETGDAQLSGVDGATGAGKFVFRLTCVSGQMLVGGHDPYKSFCPNKPGETYTGGTGVDIYAENNYDKKSLFSYKLVADESGNGTLSFQQARDAFASGDMTVAPADIDPLSQSFVTAPIVGPGTLSSATKLFLVLQAKNTNPAYSDNASYSSFLFFPVSVDLVQP